MKYEQQLWSKETGWKNILGQIEPDKATLVLYFGGREAIQSGEIYRSLATQYPKAHVVGCSTGGEIVGSEVHDNTVTSIALQFTATRIKVTSCPITTNSFDTGVKIAQDLKADDLVGIFVLSDGIVVNGSDLVSGVTSLIDKKIPLTGGLAGDGSLFQQTLVGCDDVPQPKNVAAIGFYGSHCKIGHGTMGGWTPFGPERIITRSEGNVLYELDGKPALSLYKTYLGEEAKNLPGSALLFPLSIRKSDNSGFIVRTILSIDEEKQSMTFAGDIPEGQIAQLMRASFNHLIQGAEEAAEQATLSEIQEEKPLAILISCIGRKLLMGQRIADEVEAVQNVFGHSIPQIGFYSYGEISPLSDTGVCYLHNQTMTITTISESLKH